MKTIFLTMLILTGGHFAFGLEIVSRVVNGGCVTYVLTSDKPLTLDARNVKVTSEGMLSNSRSDPIPSRRYCVSHGITPMRSFDASSHSDHSSRKLCHEWINLTASLDQKPLDTRNSITKWDGHPLVLTMEFQHHHPGLGRFPSLYGERSVEITIGGEVVRDAFSWMPRLTKPHEIQLKPIPSEMTDGRSAALYLILAEPSAYSWHSGEMEVRRDTRYRLTFRYRTARGNEDRLCVRISRYREDQDHRHIFPSAETVLPDSPCWKKADIEIDTGGVTSILFSITLRGDEIGDAWIDDMHLREVGWWPSGP
jgi:hypothetical protein